MSNEFRNAIQAVFAHGEEEARELIKLLTPEEVEAGLAAVKAYEKLVLNV